jgi:hypothetical protein
MDCSPLLLALDRVRSSVKKAPLLVLAGAGSDHSDLILTQTRELGLLDDVRVFVDLPSACLAGLYAACDVFVSPADSASESFGLTILEAMACGKPVVASDWDGYRDTIVHGQTGFTVRSRWADCLKELNQMAPFLDWTQQHLHLGQSVSIDVPEMAGYLKQLLENSELRQTMGHRGRARIEENYSWHRIIPRWHELWTELLDVSSSVELPEQDPFDYLDPNYFACFSHYASEIVDSETPVALTERGKELLVGKHPVYLHPWDRGFLAPQYLQASLLALKPSGWFGARFKVGDLLTVLQKTHHLSRDRALMHIMWLAKYDLIGLGSS